MVLLEPGADLPEAAGVLDESVVYRANPRSRRDENVAIRAEPVASEPAEG